MGPSSYEPHDANAAHGGWYEAVAAQIAAQMNDGRFFAEMQRIAW